ncbi:hypothetical protein Cgig2_006389 [Carnegiea gigantea]|uniref:DUF4283 domain-containing protein n=1 Tax=Carnegiea gigantea TaxID=171969 RepID=A0A9Q1GJJ3_9CARY|nr:hypothetical protein Cgig2_006389 [Carnegiea gigantea]
MDIDKVMLVRKGVYLIRFHNLEDRTKVLKQGWYFFDRKPFLVKAWNEDLSLDTSSLHSIPIWIRLPGLALKYWGLECLSKLGSMLGIPIKTDRIIKEKAALGFARLLVEMPFEGPFPDHIDFVSDGDRVIRQEVQYEWKPVMCNHCKLLGHKDQYCRKKGRGKMEWRVKAKTNQPVNEEQGPETIATTIEQVLDQRNGVFVSPTRIAHRVSLPPDKMSVEESSNPFTRSILAIEGFFPPLMDSFLTWNVWGLNGLTKQEDVKCFLHKQGVPLVALLETKVRRENMNQVANKVFGGW